MKVMGLAPWVPAHRPRAAPRWWVARGQRKDASIALEEAGALPEPVGLCGLAAPTSLPEAFLEYLEGQGVALAGLTRQRLFAHARGFAARRERGKKHPRRGADESLSALDRRRLALFYAAQPLLHTDPLEVDVPAFLRSLRLPCTQLAGSLPDAVTRRAQILGFLSEGVLGFAVRVQDRNLPIASYHALCAVVAWCAAARETAS